MKYENIIIIAKLLISLGAFGFLVGTYSGVTKVQNQMTGLSINQDTLKKEISKLKIEYKTHNFNDSIFQHTIQKIVKINSENIGEIAKYK